MEHLSVMTRDGICRALDVEDVRSALADAFLRIEYSRREDADGDSSSLSAFQSTRLQRTVDTVWTSLRRSLRPYIRIQELELRMALALILYGELAVLRAFIGRRTWPVHAVDPVDPEWSWAARSSPMHDTEHGIDGREHERGHDAGRE